MLAFFNVIHLVMIRFHHITDFTPLSKNFKRKLNRIGRMRKISTDILIKYYLRSQYKYPLYPFNDLVKNFEAFSNKIGVVCTDQILRTD